ncbi:MAG: dTDP-glucose 4,6-dehydratase [Desulfurococcaceae archaeon]
MKILVAGGAGFIGSNFVRYLVKTKNWDVLVYDKLTYAGRVENLHDVLDRIRFVRGDIADYDLLVNTIAEFKPSVIVNFAAETHVDRSINEPGPFVKTNILGVYTILEALRGKFRGTLLLHVSTDEVYGDMSEKNELANEDYALNPSSPYSASKASGDLLIKAYGRTYGIRYRIVRPCNNYGPYQHPEKLVPRTIIRLLHGKPAVIYGDGSQVRDWLYVEDTVRAIVDVIEKGEDNQVYNICGSIFASVKDIVKEIVRLMGKDPSRDIIFGRKRPGEDQLYAMKCEKIRKLGWHPLVDLNKGLEKTVEWYMENTWWWKPLVDEKYVLADEPW